MKKWTLILFIAFWLLLLLAFSGGYDNRKISGAWCYHHEAPVCGFLLAVARSRGTPDSGR